MYSKPAAGAGRVDSNSVPELRKKVFPVSAAVIELVEVTFSTRVSVSAAAFNSATVAVKLVVPSFNVP